MDTNTGGPAFPPHFPDSADRGVPISKFFTGLTVRDYFAAAALPELIRTALDLDHVKWEATAEHAYVIADAMLTERAK